MKNEYGVDVDYFSRKLKLIQRDIKLYTKDELARELARLSKTANSSVLTEAEFK